MAEAAIASTVLTVGKGIWDVKNARDQARAMDEQAQYQAELGEINARVADMQAKDAIDRGSAEASNRLKEVNKIIGAQTAAYAAAGVSVAGGAPTQLAEDTRRLGEYDAMTIKNNAWREAYGFKAQALNDRIQGALGIQAARNAGKNTIISAGIKAGADIAQSGAGIYKEYSTPKR